MRPSAKKIDEEAIWLGFDSAQGRLLAGSETGENLWGGVPWGNTIFVPTRPQVPFRAVRLLVHRPVASSFLIHSIRVGPREALASTAPIPADAFLTDLDKLATIEELFKQDKAYEIKINKGGAELLGMPLLLPTAWPGTEITMTIENIDSDKRNLRFIAGMLGVGDSSR